MASPSYNSIHRQQLFHWIGFHIERDTVRGEPLTDPLRNVYLDCLEDALTTGLWAKVPRNPDQLGDGKLVKVKRPITCFTEWSLGQSQPHAKRYGRLALGFPKTFVSKRGGQPVTYVRDSTRRDPYVSAINAIARFTGTLKESDDAEEIKKHVEYLSHFVKRMKKLNKEPLSSLADATPAAHPEPSARPARKPNRPRDLYSRTFGTTLHYMEEREWRIVYDDSLDSVFKKGPQNGQPEYYIPFKPGRELYTIALPDNRTVNLAFNRERLFEKLFPKDAPHVTIISLQDIGTF